MNILMLLDQFSVGGTETHVITLCDALNKVNIKTIIATLNESKSISPYKSKFIFKVIDQYEYMSRIESLKKLVTLYKIDLIHCHSLESMILARKLYDVTNTPYIITIHGLYYPKDLLLYACEKAKHIIAVSKPVKKLVSESITENGMDKISLIYNGIKIKKDYEIVQNNNLKYKLGIPINAKVILYCSRLSFSKGRLAENFIHQSKNLLKDNIYILIVGNGVKKKSIDFYANQINCEYKKNKIITIGNIYNINAYYGISDIVVGTGRVAIEALNFSKPIICTGIKDYLGIFSFENNNEILDTYFGDHGFNHKIEKLSIESSIRYLLENPGKYKEISDWGKSYCDSNFDLDKLIKQYMVIIN
ncbi:glycosyltransferase [Paraclostridium bifermentans]|uniref:glycosyltransferase n=1 Tax=Paraclostridium bifermentans TaxID=1490 RepID=UPI003D2B5408